MIDQAKRGIAILLMVLGGFGVAMAINSYFFYTVFHTVLTPLLS
jgi:hypothetical protein